MSDDFAAFIYRTRGLYMFVALTISIALKYYFGGATPLSFFLVSVVAAAIVQAFRMYAASFLLGRQAVTAPQADFLATSGPYAYIRNPLYLGNFLIGLAVCLAINEWYAYVLFVLSYAFVYSIVIPYEERFLREKFGDTYMKYTAQTGRLLPKLKGYKAGMKLIPDYRAGILGEIHVPLILGIMYVVIYLLFVRTCPVRVRLERYAALRRTGGRKPLFSKGRRGGIARRVNLPCTPLYERGVEDP